MEEKEEKVPEENVILYLEIEMNNYQIQDLDWPLR